MNDLADEDFCYLTTTGRVSGAPHEIEIWFAVRDTTGLILSGGGRSSDWVANIIAEPRVRLRIGGHTFDATARVVTDPAEERAARDLVWCKYQEGYDGDLRDWRETALPIAVDLTWGRAEVWH